jgi:hypothetical protein
MGMDLRNRADQAIKVSGGHWAVFLKLAEAFGWQPAGTEQPETWPASETWHGRYDTNDGQSVTDADAIRLAQTLHGAAVHPQIQRALSDVIRYVESAVKASGIKIREEWEMHPTDFFDEFSPLLEFLYQGGFVIE